MAKSRKEKPTVNPRSKSVKTSGGKVDDTFVVTQPQDPGKSNEATSKELQVSVEKCDAFVKAESVNSDEDLESSLNSDEEPGETLNKPEKEDPSDDENADDEDSSNNVSHDSEESRLNNVEEGSEEDNSSDEEQQPKTKHKIIIPGDSEKSKSELPQGAKRKLTQIKGPPVSRNPGKVASVADKKKIASKISKSVPASKKTDSKVKSPKQKPPKAGSSKEVTDKPVSSAKKDLMLDMIMAGLTQHEERKGVSAIALKKYLVEHDDRKRNWEKIQAQAKKTLGEAIETGQILRPKGNEHLNGMVGRFKVNKKFRVKKAIKEKDMEPEAKEPATSKETKVSKSKPVTAAKTAKKPAKNENQSNSENLPAKPRGRPPQKASKRPMALPSTEDSEDEFLETFRPKTAKGARRKSRSGVEVFKPKTNGPTKAKVVKRSHSADAATSSKPRAGPKSKKLQSKMEDN